MADRRGEMQATPRNALMGYLADALGGVNNYAQRKDPRMPGGLANPVAGLLSNALSVPSLATTADRMSYGAPLTNARQANVPWLKPETADALMMAPVSPRNALAAASMGMGGVDNGMLKSMLLYHGTNFGRPIKSVGSTSGGVFDGMFASPMKTNAGSHGSNMYRFTVPDERVAPRDLSDFLELPNVQKVLSERVVGPNRGAVIDHIAKDNEMLMSSYGNPLIAEEDVMYALAKARDPTSAADLSWEAQNIRGHIAKAAGFDAVPMMDEHGVSYLIPPGGPQPRPYSQEARNLARGIAPEPYVPPSLPPVRQSITLDQWRALPDAEKAARAGDIRGARLRGADRDEVARFAR